MTETPAAHDNPSRLGRFIQNYSGFLSSFVIGVAGLVATSIWQFRQAQNAERLSTNGGNGTRSSASRSSPPVPAWWRRWYWPRHARESW